VVNVARVKRIRPRKIVLAGTLLAAVLAALLLALVAAVKLTQAAFPSEYGKIVFMRDQLFTMDPDGSDQTQLTHHKSGGLFPTWSPNGRKIAFSRYGGSPFQSDIYIMSADGSHKVPITASDKSEGSISWSPSGKRLVFDRLVSGCGCGGTGNYDLFTIRSDGSNQIRLTRTERPEVNPAWSPGGKKIAFAKTFSRFYAIFVMKADGSQAPSLLVRPRQMNYPKYSPQGVEWSPDGQWLVFSFGWRMYKVKADGTELTHLSSGGWPAWSPDGTKIIFTDIRDGDSQDYTLYTMNTDGTDQKRLVEGPEGRGSTPSWQPPN
jgi:Tol biopolymer transport system component